MGKVVFAIYKAFETKEKELLDLVKIHYAILLKQGIITYRPRIVLKAKNGEIIEIFEWNSQEALDKAHPNTEIAKLWKKFSEICTYQQMDTLLESKGIFQDFEPIAF